MSIKDRRAARRERNDRIAAQEATIPSQLDVWDGFPHQPTPEMTNRLVYAMLAAEAAELARKTQPKHLRRV